MVSFTDNPLFINWSPIFYFHPVRASHLYYHPPKMIILEMTLKIIKPHKISHTSEKDRVHGGLGRSLMLSHFIGELPYLLVHVFVDFF